MLTPILFLPVTPHRRQHLCTCGHVDSEFPPHRSVTFLTHFFSANSLESDLGYELPFDLWSQIHRRLQLWWAEANWRKHVPTEDRDRWRRVWRIGGRQGTKECASEDYFDRPHKPSRVPAAALPGGDFRAVPGPDRFSHPWHSSESEEHDGDTG